MLLRSGDWIAEMDVCEITMRRRRFPGKPLHLVTRVGACLARSLVDRSAAAHLESSTKKLSELWGPTAKPRLSVLWMHSQVQRCRGAQRFGAKTTDGGRGWSLT